jgi:hypothetical protein
MSYSITIPQVLFSILGFLVIIWLVREAVHSLRAGPTRFRLPLGSMVTASRGGQVSISMVFLVFAFLWLPTAYASRSLYSLVVPIMFCCAALSRFQDLEPRRHLRRWLVLAAGLIPLAVGVVFLAFGLGLTPVGIDSLFPGLPQPLVLVLAVFLMAASAPQVREALFGTRLREHGIEIFGRTYSLSSIRLNGWRDGDGESMLRLTVRAPRLFDTAIGGNRDFRVPVPASDRPTLEAFLAGFPDYAGPRHVAE